MEKKRITISAKRQITIPLKYYEMLNFDTEAECTVRGNELVIRPVKEAAGGEFAEQILADLISKGLQGDELLTEFKAAQKKVRPAVEEMLCEAKLVAEGKGEYYTDKDIFEPEDEA